MLDKQMRPHLKALDIGVEICQKQLCSSIRDDHTTFLVKNTLFIEEVTWQPLKELESCPPSLLEPLSRAFIWGIVCLSTIIGCGEIKGNVNECQFCIVQIDKEQLSSFFRGFHATSSLQSVFFTRKVVWWSLIELQSWYWHITV